MKNKTKYIVSICIFIFCLLLFLANSILIEYFSFPWWTLIITCTLFISSIVVIGFIYFKNTEFICPHCNTQFKPKTLNSVIAIHFWHLRYLRCPNCNKKSWCKDKFIEKETTYKNKETNE